MSIVGYRKLIVTMASIASASVLVALGHIGDGVYSTVMLATVGGFLAANVTQKAVAKTEVATQ